MIALWAQVPKWGKYVAVAVILLGSALLVLTKIENIRSDGVATGVNQEQSKNIAVTLERVELSREVTDEIRKEADTGNGSLLYAQCLRSARTPANCKRFLPVGSETKR